MLFNDNAFFDNQKDADEWMDRQIRYTERKDLFHKNGTLRRLSDDDMYCLSDKRLSYNATYNIISKCSGMGISVDDIMSDIRFLQNCYKKDYDDKDIDEIKLKMQKAYKSLGAYELAGDVNEKLDITPVTKTQLKDLKDKLYMAGDIIYWYYSYSSAFPNFYKVIRATNKTVWAVPIGKKVTRGAVNMPSYAVVADPNDIISTKPSTFRIQKNGKIYYSRRSMHEVFQKWDGNEIECCCD